MGRLETVERSRASELLLSIAPALSCLIPQSRRRLRPTPSGFRSSNSLQRGMSTTTVGSS